MSPPAVTFGGDLEPAQHLAVIDEMPPSQIGSQKVLTSLFTDSNMENRAHLLGPGLAAHRQHLNVDIKGCKYQSSIFNTTVSECFRSALLLVDAAA